MKLFIRKAIFMVPLCLSFTFVRAQTESGQNKAAFLKFMTYYNAGQPDSVFALFSAEAKVKLPLDKTTAFLAQLKARYGTMQDYEYTGSRSEFSSYKTVFQNGVVLLQLSANAQQEITGLYAQPYQANDVKNVNRTAMQLPFEGTWTIFWGGNTKEQNQHVGVRFQKNAFDIVITDEHHQSFRTDGKSNPDYYAFGREILSPCHGVVVSAVDGVRDNVPGTVNTLYIPGNTIIIRTDHNEYVFMAHFKQHSIRVKEGDVVKPGQLLGLCGNSGNSSEPHLHIHLQDLEDALEATGIECHFARITVDGVRKRNYSPVKGERVSN
ncbi:peptidase M23 [Mucilaginibacter limnophilus]|uniref:Peptidase M23 n=1 Tax=Mucilaginibacter limnophilus TaxID=1932778 RepID=A0A437MZQ6_9SPHI|nr:M23 family metallopeptidase [Mucilaginibacter limnophilus]RVU03150.1 peptidase M23 [Mucilaginibacter limnophilus]